MKTRVYIDGQSGTTGLQIYDRIGARDDLELLRIDEDKRHDPAERRKFLNAADIGERSPLRKRKDRFRHSACEEIAPKTLDERFPHRVYRRPVA